MVCEGAECDGADWEVVEYDGAGPPNSSPSGYATSVLAMLTFSVCIAGDADGPKLTFGRGVTPRLTWLRLLRWDIFALLFSADSTLGPDARKTSGTVLFRAVVEPSSATAACPDV